MVNLQLHQQSIAKKDKHEKGQNNVWGSFFYKLEDGFISNFPQFYYCAVHRTELQERMRQSTVRKPSSLGVTSRGVDFSSLTELRS